MLSRSCSKVAHTELVQEGTFQNEVGKVFKQSPHVLGNNSPVAHRERPPLVS